MSDDAAESSAAEPTQADPTRAERRAATRAERFARAFDDKSAGLDRFGLVLVLTVASVVGLSLLDIVGVQREPSQDVGAALAAVLVALTLVTALRASGLSARRQRMIDAVVLVVIVGYVVTLFGHLTPPGQAGPGVSAVLVILSILAPIVIVLRLVRHREVTIGTIMGAISAYLLIAVAYFYVFLTMGGTTNAFFSTSTPQGSTSYMYFSLTTITTVGYGDLTAASRLGRLLATSEAVIGQVYLVVFVAFIVSLGATSWRDRRDAAAQDASSGDD